MVNQKYTSQQFLYVLFFHIVAPRCKILTNTSSIDIEGIRTVFVLYFFFMKDILNIKKHKQKYLSNIQPSIFKQKTI